MNYKDYIIKNFDNWTLYLHENQTYLGRCYLWYVNDDPLDLFELNRSSLKELFEITNDIKSVLSKCFMPDMFNYASFNNIIRHLHFHIIPRYQSKVTFGDHVFEDKNWGDNYAPYSKDFFISEKTVKLILKKINNKLG